jgi:outer membrane protein assembly factor BamB
VVGTGHPTFRLAAFAFLTLLALLTASAPAANWPAWRGPTGQGLSTEKNLPTHWSATENVKWRIALPERGNSTPVTWGDRIFLTQPVGDRRTLLCLNRADGKQLWEQGVATREKELTHGTNPYCSGSPVTDGERVIVSFASDGLFCYDLNGKELWRRTDLGRQVHIWGAGVSPVLLGNLCFLNFGPGETTYLLAVDNTTGKTVWKHDEDTGYGKPPAADVKGGKATQGATYIGSWTTPVVAKIEGKDQLLMSWPRRLAAYEPQTGKELWICAGLNPLVYTSPIFTGDTVVAMGGFGGTAIGVRAGGSGDITATRRLWQQRSPQRIGSGVIHEGHVYIHNDPGTAMCLDLKTGQPVWTETLAGEAPTKVNWSSVMLADGLCYTITQGGDCFVFKASPKFELVATNPLGEPSNSSVVPSNGELLIRTHKSLWCIAAKK